MCEDLHKMQIMTAIKTGFYGGFYWLLKAGVQSVTGEVLLAGAKKHVAGFLLEDYVYLRGRTKFLDAWRLHYFLRNRILFWGRELWSPLVPPGGLPGGTCGTSHNVDKQGTSVGHRSQHGWAKRASGTEQACSALHWLLLPQPFWVECRPCALLPIQIIICLTPAIALLSL